ncbi:laccase 2 precursor [Mycena rebaudengoi]|nr:laccase 2 precursor [Mycena rebaudengoi]
MILSAALVALSAVESTYAAIGPSASIPIINKVISPDGFPRSAVLAGGTFPGPVIRRKKGDRFLLNVEDRLTNITMLKSTSIHWHGLFQKGTSYADGPAFVTRWFWTFWYHSHLSTQYCDGLRGAFVVEDPNGPARHLYDVDNDSTTITLGDWHPPIPKSDATLINGLGRFEGGLAVISVTHGKRYRFRLISVSCDPNFIFSIDGHSMTIIEVDGVNHKPLTVGSIQIFAGQRYSFVLTANNKVDSYWVRAPPTLQGTNQGFVNATNSAVLRYVGAPIRDSTTNSTSTQPLVETALHLLVKTPVPGARHPNGGDVNLNLVIAVNITSGRFEINNASFLPPTAPVLLQILSGAHSAQGLLPKGSIYDLPPNKVIEVSIPGGTRGAPTDNAGPCTYTLISLFPSSWPPWSSKNRGAYPPSSGLAIVLAEDIPDIRKQDPPAAWDKLCPIYDASDKN